MIPKKIKMKRTRGRNRHYGTSMNHILCKTVVAMVILEGLNGTGSGGSGGVLLSTAKADGTTYSNTNSSNSHYFRQHQSTFGGSNFGNSGNGNSFISTLGPGIDGDAIKRMRDRCGRYSLLKVLQQWETLQKRCRLSIRNSNLYKRYGKRYEYDTEMVETNGMGIPSSSETDEIKLAKRSRHPYYGGLTVNNYREVGETDRNNYYEMNADALESCCPTVFEVIAPIYGRNRSGHMVELYKDENVHQEFYEYRCHKDYLDKPCRYLDNHHRKISKCVQQYLDTYALVRSASLTGWSMQHIKVASGCACKVDPVKAASRRRKKLSSSQKTQLRSSFPDFFLSSRNNNNNDKINERSSFQPFRSRNTDY